MKRNYRIYIDESRQCSEHYMVLGGIITTTQELPEIQSRLEEFRYRTKMHREFKWTKVSKKMLSNYCDLVNLIADLISQKHLHFKAVVFDTREFNHKQFSDGDGEKTFYKLMYQFILHKFGKYLTQEDIAIVHLDQRNSSYRLQDLKPILNAGIRKKYQLTGDPIRALVPLDSKTSDLIQMADLLMGAIGFENNGFHHAPGAGPAKCGLIKHIASRFQLPTLCCQTLKDHHEFEIWRFHFRPKT